MSRYNNNKQWTFDAFRSPVCDIIITVTDLDYDTVDNSRILGKPTAENNNSFGKSSNKNGVIFTYR